MPFYKHFHQGVSNMSVSGGGGRGVGWVKIKNNR